MRLLLLCLAMSICVTGCSDRLTGDEQGVPVTFQIELAPSYAERHQRHFGTVNLDDSLSYGGGHHGTAEFGTGYRVSTTEVALRGGSIPGAANLFEISLSWGENTAVVPLMPGRELYLSVQIYGGRQGFDDLGGYKVDSTRYLILLGANGPQILVSEQHQLDGSGDGPATLGSQSEQDAAVTPAQPLADPTRSSVDANITEGVASETSGGAAGGSQIHDTVTQNPTAAEAVAAGAGDGPSAPVGNQPRAQQSAATSAAEQPEPTRIIETTTTGRRQP